GGALLDLVSDGETGVLVPPRDAPALRAAVERLLADPSLRERLGRAGRESARERFGWDGVVERTLAVYRDVLGA
ncbi:MAG TPA: glycosyltransferase, partial [Gaiellaceae bacterium]|nr:glycosyltransferase [Gaiellaceae bacterium]